MVKFTEMTFPAKTIGLDLGDRVTQFTVRDEGGEVVTRGKLPTTRDAFEGFFAEERGTRVVYEVGSHSPWITWLLNAKGCEPVVANPRRVKLISQSLSKCDRKDADMLSDFGFLKPSTLAPITHRGPEGAGLRAVLTARAALVRSRTALTNCVRGLVKSIGHRLPGCDPENLHKKMWVPEELRAALIPLRDQLRDLSKRIADFDRFIERTCEHDYPETAKLRAVGGVGPVTSLTFVATIEDPWRFSRSREVGAYVGLAPRVASSSEANPELRITKAGKGSLRALLVQCAHYILGPHGKDCDLRRLGERIAARGGKNAKKRAAVAVARKLAVLLHRLWVSDEPYDPLRNAKAADAEN